MPAAGRGILPTERLVSPPRPPLPGQMPPERVFQVPTLRFGSDTRPEHRDVPPASRAEGPHGLADLRWRPSPILTGRSLWQHDVRRLVGGYRVCVPHLETIVRSGAPAVSERWTISRHAHERMTEMGLTRRDVLAAVKHPDLVANAIKTFCSTPTTKA